MRGRGRWIGAAAVLVALLALGGWGLAQAREFESLARAGKADAAAAARSLSANDAPAALDDFTKAGDEFRRARDLLGPAWLRGIPWLGTQLNAADDLATIGVEGSAGGAEAARITTTVAGMQGAGGLNEVLARARPHIDAALGSLVVVAEREARLSPDGLVPPLASAVAEARRTLAPMKLLLSRSTALRDLERYLYSGTHRFLVVAQNSSELRPTGGFMGSYGLLAVGPQGLSMERFADVYTLPRDTLDLPLPPGGQVNYRHFYFRNSNWWMDFPTSARQMLVFWANLRQPPVDGVIAVDIPFLQALLRVHGPVTVPETRRTIEAATVMEVLNEVVQVEKSGQEHRRDRKLAIVSLVGILFDWLGRLPQDQVDATVKAISGAAEQKHVQFYLTDETAQAAVVAAGWSGALAPPAGTTDLVAVSNGVIKPSKANAGVTKELGYDVSLKPDGSAETVLSLGYRKAATWQVGVPQQWLANYVRVHRLAGTGATPVDGTGDAFEQLQDATGLPTFGRYFRLDRGGQATYRLATHVPNAVQPGAVAPLPGQQPATPGPSSSPSLTHYRLLVAKQADLVDTRATITVRVPEGWTLAGSSAQFRASGAAVRTSDAAGTVTVTTPLTEDLVLDVTASRP